MSTPEPLPHGDFPLPIPQVDGAPTEWTAEAIAELAKLPPDQLQEHIAKLLAWYVTEDDINFGQSGNEYWEAGNYMSKALLSALQLKTGVSLLPAT